MDKAAMAKVDELIAEGDLAEAGREAGRMIRARMAGPPPRGDRRMLGLERKAEVFYPATAEELIFGGGLHGSGMARLEYQAGMQARDEAIRGERERWLPQLEAWHAEAEAPLRYFLAKEIKRLRLGLGIKRTPDEVRQRTRERVRRYRERRAGSRA